MKTKRPISIWLTQLVLLLMGVAGGYSVYATYTTLSYYSIQGLMWRRFEVWSDGLTCIACLVAFVGLCFRWRFARWLAVIVLLANAGMGTYAFFRTGPNTSISVSSAVLGLLVVILPLVALTGFLILSKKVKVFFGLEAAAVPEEALPLPPPPPTFDD